MVNVVKFKTDRASLKAVRNDMKKLQKSFLKQRNYSQSKNAGSKQAYTAQMQQQKQVQQQQKQAAKQTAVDAKAKANEQKKISGGQTRFENSTATDKEGGNSTGKCRLSKKTCCLPAWTPQNMRRSRSLRCDQTGKRPRGCLCTGNTSLKSMTQALSQHLVTQRSIARIMPNRPNNQVREKIWLIWLAKSPASAFIPGEILGPTAAACAAQQAYQIISGTLAGAIERNQGRKMISSMGLNPLEADAAIQKL
ncbi:hypothetical protein DMH27_02205 [Raoultella planticola]|nr:hypothetical protein [Raoultella planticola]